MKKSVICRMAAWLLSSALCVSLCTGVSANAQEVSEGPVQSPDNQNGEDVTDTSGNVKATWDCVWFGSYPQAEVVSSRENYTAIDGSILEDGDIIEDEGLYTSLAEADENAWEGNDITLDGERYRRIQSTDIASPNLQSVAYKWESDGSTYHYFKYEPVKWRVLKVNEGQALLLSDIVLDTEPYNVQIPPDPRWESSAIRKWLNGYELTTENELKFFKSKSFIESAFTEEEQSAIAETDVVNARNSDFLTDAGNNTKDRIFLLSESEACGDSARAYGFGIQGDSPAATRQCKSSTYAKAAGAEFYAAADTGRGFSAWWLRTPGNNNYYTLRSTNTGEVRDDVMLVHYFTGVRAALNLNLSSDHGACYAGKVSSDGTVDEVSAGDRKEIENLGGPAAEYAAGETGFRLRNPKIKEFYNTIEKVVWDCVWFGSYPQAEVIESKESYTAVGQDMLEDGDVLENAELYSKLQTADESAWEGNDITLDGERYRRMKRGDAVGIGSNANPRYKWEDDVSTYHYFKYEPVKWRVLKVDGDQAFLLSDIVLDNQQYDNRQDIDVTWENSMIRNWLNGQENGYKSKSFMETAFSEEEKSQILMTDVVNAANSESGIDGGNDTKDQIFLLSKSEASGENAKAYGFPLDDKNAVTRQSKSSTYAKAMGADFNYSFALGYSSWWLRTPGKDLELGGMKTSGSYNVGITGSIQEGGSGVMITNCSVRCALNLKLPSAHDDYYAGRVSSDGTVAEVAPKDKNEEPGEPGEPENPGAGGDTGNGGDSGDTGNGGNSGDTGNGGDNSNPGGSGSSGTNNPPASADKPVKVSKITLSGISKQIAAGKKIKLTARVTPSNASQKAVTWKSDDKKIATVNSAGVVRMKKRSGGKSVVITATATDGSKVKASYRIKSMKGMVKKITISGEKSVKAGKTLKLRAEVKASKKANKKLKWSSSNKKYATVSSSGRVKTRKAGKGRRVKITARATDGSGKKKSVTIKIN